MNRWDAWTRRWLTRQMAVLLTVGLLAACGTKVVNPVTGKTERTVMDEATEIAEGRKAHQQVLAEYGAIKDARLQAYVNDIGQRLAKQSHRAQLPWTFTVLDSPEVNAFALPGGFIYITRGIMAYLDSEAELAGVLGHEIGHVTARHGAQRATREQTAGLGVFAATILGAVLESQGVGGAVDLASQASQSFAAGLVARYSRDQELQADQLGAEYLARNRYNPQNMVDVIAVLKNQELFAADQAKAEGRQIAQGSHWLASHPSNDTRLIAIRETAAKLAGQFVDDNRARYQSAIEGMTFGDGRDQGVVRGRNFYHEDLGIALSAPAGWQVQNGAQAITVVNSAGDAGLIVRVVPPDAGKTHDDIIRSVIKPTQGQVERRQLNGLAATHFVGQVRNAQGQAQGVRVTVATGPGNRNYLMQYAARDAAALQRAGAGLLEAEASFRALSAADRAAARPWALRTVAFPRGGWEELARSSPLGDRALAQLRLINGAYGAGADPRVGTAVKVVQ
jgi:predicted Zn-dependent protease